MEATREELLAELEQLEHEERTLSLRRGTIHERVALYPEQAGDLETREHELSTRRREVHTRIDALRAQLEQG